ncbi:MAG: hypothetical protein WA747_04515, partial [Steroidobacteraceae bacterium]
MSRLPDTLLDINELESGAIKPELHDFKVAELFEALHREFAGVAAAAGVQLRVEPCEASAYGDARLIRQIVARLLASALTHPAQSRVTLRGRGEQAAVLLEVEAGDDGPEPTDVRRLVELLGLRLEVTSATDRGAVSCLRLPRGRSA